jgi:hypothetical protein
MDENINVFTRKIVQKFVTGNYTTEERLTEIKQTTLKMGYTLEECNIENQKFYMLFERITD